MNVTELLGIAFDWSLLIVFLMCAGCAILFLGRVMIKIILGEAL